MGIYPTTHNTWNHADSYSVGNLYGDDDQSYCPAYEDDQYGMAEKGEEYICTPGELFSAGVVKVYAGSEYQGVDCDAHMAGLQWDIRSDLCAGYYPGD